MESTIYDSEKLFRDNRNKVMVYVLRMSVNQCINFIQNMIKILPKLNRSMNEKQRMW